MAIDVPLNITESGPIPTPPATLRQTLVTSVAAQVPDYTSDLPGTLIEDVASTDTGALAMIDQARVDAIQALAIVANAYLTIQLGQQTGILQGEGSNTSVNIVFSTPSSGAGSSPGYVIAQGFLVSDGSHQYRTLEGTIIGADFLSNVVTAVATQAGSWAVPEGSVNQIITSVPSPYAITVTNPQAGTPSAAPETLESYQARVLQAQKALGIGIVQYLYTALQAIPGVVPRLVNVMQVSAGWKVIVGGGDVYAVALAIFLGVSDISRLSGSTEGDRNVSVDIIQPPNTYSIIFINPPDQAVTGTITWNTNLPNFTSGAQVNALAAPALTNYINSIQQGQPINELDMVSVFQAAVASVLPISNIIALDFDIEIDGVETAPDAGTSVIPGDTESYFSASNAAFTVTQG
jgi:hypothetical protein